MKYKKVVLLTISFLIVGISTLLYFVVEENKKQYASNSNIFAILLEDSDGEYIESDLNTFPSDYLYNGNKSYCINGSALTWNGENRTISINATNSEKCYVYFDRVN